MYAALCGLLNKLETPVEAKLRWENGSAAQIGLPPSGKFTVSSEMENLPSTIEVSLPSGRSDVVEMELFEAGSVQNQVGWKITPTGVEPLYFGELARESQPGASSPLDAAPLPATKLRE